MSKRTTLLTGGAICVAAALAAPAGAQEVAYARDHNKSVRDRAFEEHRPLGIRTGGFLLLPELTLGVQFNDNIYAATTGETDDTIFVANPSATLESQWSVHRLRLFAGAETRTFTDADDDNAVDWRIGGDGQIDVNRDMYFTGSLFTGQETEARYSGNGPAALIEPIEYDYTQGGVGFVRNVNRIRASIGANWATYDFEDGRLPGNIPFEQDDRDHDAWDATGRLDFAVSPDTAIFGSVTRRERDYDLDLFDRDSEGWRYLTGANFDITSVIRGEIGVGYSTTEYDNALLSDTDGFAASGRVEWFPTQLTTVTFDALRDTIDSDIALSSAIERTGFGFRVDHELRRDIILHGEAAYDQDEYEGIDRDDDRTRYNVGGDWHMNRSVAFGAGFQHFSQESAGVNRDRDFDVNQVMFTVTLRR